MIREKDIERDQYDRDSAYVAAMNGGRFAETIIAMSDSAGLGVCVCLHPFVECACVTGTSGCIFLLHMLSNYSTCGDPFFGTYTDILRRLNACLRKTRLF